MSIMSVWWEQTLAGRHLCEDILNALKRGRSIWLELARLPWPDTLRSSIRDALYDIDSDMVFLIMDAKDQAKPCEMAAAEWIGESAITPSGAMRALRNQAGVLWVYGIDNGLRKDWRELSCKLCGLNSSLSLVLETAGDGAVHKGVTALSMDEYQKPFDLLLYAMLLLVNNNLDSRLIGYASSLCACLADKCAEKCAFLTANIAAVMENPASFAQEAGIADAVAEQAIRHAQMSTLWPLLETRRLKMILGLGKRAEQLLPMRDDYGQEIDRAEMLELRHLYYGYRQGTLRLERGEIDKLQRLLDVRNEMAHLHMLPFTWVEELLMLS